ncbi:hypothetical protein SAMN02982994_4931 [Azospirillum lipoferum]|nr:hypothetical protein SAMN02982994_4931 [Azospirillum lipoferum]
MARFGIASLALAAALAGGWLTQAAPAAAQSTKPQGQQPEWSEGHNQRPTKRGDEALPAGTLTVRTAATAPGALGVYVRNGFPFDVVLTRVDATECVNIVPTDCGPIGQNIRVATGAETLVRTLHQADPARSFGATPTYSWQPAVAAK